MSVKMATDNFSISVASNNKDVFLAHMSGAGWKGTVVAHCGHSGVQAKELLHCGWLMCQRRSSGGTTQTVACCSPE